MRRILSTLVVGLALTLGLAQAQGVSLAESDTTTVHSFADESEIADAYSRLIRTGDGIAMELRTNGLQPGGAYTVWWVIFNNPGACSAAPGGDMSVPACGEDDLLAADGALAPNPLVRAAILWATGNVADAEGKAHFSAYLPEAATVGEVVYGTGLEDARKAEVHLVVREHGMPDAMRIHQQLNTFEPDVAMGGFCEACTDVQFAVHLPPP